ncbi:MAG: hypothetical protein WBP33_16480, partial [Saprospiraceae bacterium]
MNDWEQFAFINFIKRTKFGHSNICFICGNQANATGSHIYPAWIIEPCIGKRNKEESFKISVSSGEVDTFYGSSNSYNNQHSILTNPKEHHHTLDHIFCNTCEHELGKIEGKMKDPLLCINDKSKINRSYNPIASLEQFHSHQLKNIDIDEFLVFWFSIAFRFYIKHFIDHNQHIFNSGEANYLRSVIHEFLVTKKINSSRIVAEYFKFYVIAKENISNDGFITELGVEGHNEFYLCNYILEFYTKTDTIIPENIEYYKFENHINNKSIIVIISNE